MPKAKQTNVAPVAAKPKKVKVPTPVVVVEKPRIVNVNDSLRPYLNL
jgi:hypothetical protein